MSLKHRHVQSGLWSCKKFRCAQVMCAVGRSPAFQQVKAFFVFIWGFSVDAGERLFETMTFLKAMPPVGRLSGRRRRSVSKCGKSKM